MTDSYKETCQTPGSTLQSGSTVVLHITMRMDHPVLSHNLLRSGFKIIWKGRKTTQHKMIQTHPSGRLCNVLHSVTSPVLSRATHVMSRDSGSSRVIIITTSFTHLSASSSAPQLAAQHDTRVSLLIGKTNNRLSPEPWSHVPP